MIKQEVMRLVRKLVDQEGYKYTHIHYMKNESNKPIDISKVDVIHLTFDMGEPLKEIQVSLHFCEKYIDLLAFPHPIIVEKKYALPTIRFLNFLNTYIKSPNGRFYLDEEFLDVAFSARIPYYLVEAYPKESTVDIISVAVDFFLDASYPLFNVSKGIIDVNQAIYNMEEIWGL